MAEFLLELLSEEIPARMQVRAAEDLERLVCERLAKAGLARRSTRAFVTPRRLALVVDGLPTEQPDAVEERKGPRVGSPAKAIDGFLRAAGLAHLEDAEVRDTDKGRFYVAVTRRAGRPTAAVLAEIIPDVVAHFPWPKSMRWGTGRASWVRPLHGLLALLDGEVVPVTLDLGGGLTLAAGSTTVGHRFLAPDPFAVSGFADYAAKLNEAKVIIDPAERRRRIGSAMAVFAKGLEDYAVRDDPALLDEVAGLVEWPVPMLGDIDRAFMDVPAEVLITAMRSHQKYFALLDRSGRLAPRFVFVANTEAAADSRAIVAGNERVLRARLSDAKYFWDQDRRQALAGRVETLKERVFHARLGSDHDRSLRLETLARWLAPVCGVDHPEFAARAALLSKADLTTQMVGEFPELQGIMGRHYALHDGERDAVADAIRDHYAPQGPNDRCPTEPVAVAVALADKIDTLVGFFAIDEKPTGSKDPFALRRAALGVIRLVMENTLRLPLRAAFAAAFAGYGRTDEPQPIVDQLLAFFGERLKVHLKEAGLGHDLIAAVMAAGGEDDIVRLGARVVALRDFLNTDDGANVLAAYRRASNIVRIEEAKDQAGYAGEADPGLLAEPEEMQLHQALAEARGRIDAALQEERFRDAMAAVARLRAPVDAFFDHVQVNCADPALRANRLRLLSQIRSALGGVADFSQIEG